MEVGEAVCVRGGGGGWDLNNVNMEIENRE